LLTKIDALNTQGLGGCLSFSHFLSNAGTVGIAFDGHCARCDFWVPGAFHFDGNRF
jgi:hypothetical protein